jgi:hypothetical protein
LVKTIFKPAKDLKRVPAERIANGNYPIREHCIVSKHETPVNKINKTWSFNNLNDWSHYMLSITPIIYESRLDQWYNRATIRNSPRRILNNEISENKLCFSPDLVPVSQHKIVKARGIATGKEILTHHLLAYLTFTDRLEYEVVNATVRRIATGQLPFSFPKQMQLDAYKIYSDEAYHSLCSADMVQQILEATKLDHDSRQEFELFNFFDETGKNYSDELRNLIELFFVIVSEILITSLLIKIQADRRVVTAVRKLVADHAEDEGRHRNYFIKINEIVCPRLSKSQIDIIGPLVPKFILKFLNPDLAVIRNYLTKVLAPSEVDQVIEESFEPTRVFQNIKITAAPTVRIFKTSGLLNNKTTKDAFRESGLID